MIKGCKEYNDLFKLEMFDFIKVTEIPNENIPLEQYNRILRRYSWATLHCQNKES